MGPSEGEWTIRREKPLLFKRHKVVRFLISPKKIILWEVNSFPAIEIKSGKDHKEDV